MGKRYWEVDALRGFALILMIFFHTFACMVVFHMIEETPEFLAFYQFFLTSTITFVTLAGVSLVLRHARQKGKTTKSYYKSIVIKATVLFVTSLIITLITWIFSVLAQGSGPFVQFGFLHMLSISMVLSIPFLKLGKWNLLVGAVIILLGFFVIPMINSPWWLFPIGIHDAVFSAGAIEYFPLFPWFGVLLAGVGLGAVLYPNGVRRFEIRDCGKVGNLLAKIGNGRVTLVVYLAHIPIIMVLLGIISMITGFGSL